MSPKFKSINTNNERVNRIINSAFKVFSQNDFEKASTSLIVKEARISRGLLYHYFKDKNELYDYLLYYSYNLIAESMRENVEWDNIDFFVRLYHSMEVKLELIRKYPFIFDFFDKYSHTINPKDFDEHRGDMFTNQKDKIHLSNLDSSLFKDNVDVEKAKRTSILTIIGIINHAMHKIDLWNEGLDVELVLLEVEEYIDFLRKQFYK